MKDLFHGTTYDLNEIDVTMGKGYKDFGKGFYANSVKSHAESMPEGISVYWKLKAFKEAYRK